MREFKGTPGPWYAVKNDHYLDIKVADGKYDQAFASTHANAEMGMTKKTEEANAQLIAAAPELLEALQDALSEIEDRCLDSGFDSNTYPVVIKIKDAINKALEL